MRRGVLSNIEFCAKGHLDVARMLIEEQGSNLTEILAAQLLACDEGHMELALMLIERGSTFVDIDMIE